MSNHLNRLIIVISFLFVTAGVNAQDFPKENSPYSRYGLGNLLTTDFPALQSLGGISSAYNNPFQLNITNPASLGSLTLTAFETGASVKVANLSSNNSDASINTVNGNLSHFALGFPLKNPLNKLTEFRRSKFDFGMSFGLVPYSIVGYDIQSEADIPNVGKVTYSYRGNGGTYQVFWGNAVRYKGLSLGLHLGYLFGSATNQRTVALNDVESAFADLFTDDYTLGGLIWRVGAQYELVLGAEKGDDAKTLLSKPRITFGAYGNSGRDINISGTSLVGRTNNFYTGSGMDTILVTDAIDGTVRLPAEFGAGIVYSKYLNWKVGVDYSMARWSDYSNPVKSDSLSNTWRLAVGGEYIPNVRSYNKYREQIRYRLGLYYGLDPRVVGNEQIEAYGITFGLGLPLRLPRGLPSFVNLGFEIGQMSAPSLISETFFRFNVGFTLNDNTWFYKQKFK